MKLLNRSTLVGVVTVALLGGSAVAANAVVGGQPAPRTYGAVELSITFPGLGVGYCGGSLVAPRWIQTGGHCVSDQLSAPTVVPVAGTQVAVHVGSTSRTTGGQTAHGVAVLLQPGWAWGTNTTGPVADLALVELDHPIYGVPLLPISPHQPAVGATDRITGWGLTAWPGTAADLPDQLQQRDVTRLPDAACAGGGISTGEICLSPGACLGDSGAPAMTHIGPWWGSVGLGSRETDETDPCGQPSVFTDTSYFADWIRTTILTGRSGPPTTMAPAVGSSTVTPAIQRRVGLLKLPLTTNR